VPAVQNLARSVHGEYNFSALPMPATGGRPSGEDMRLYMESYAHLFVNDNIRYNVEVLDIRRVSRDAPQTNAPRWIVIISDKISGRQELKFDKIVLCTGVCGVHLYPVID
jgi:cation diffusion facilitator CzcD-associated flavoprotein CzcO